MARLAQIRPEIEAWVASKYRDPVLIRQGGQRIVFRVETPALSALKIWVADDAAQHMRHVREVSALDQLDHPGLPGVVQPITQIDLRQTPLAMYQEEWISADPVSNQISPAASPKIDAALDLLASSADALAMLHSKKIVHRDISANNVLWDGKQAFIIDLGLAKHLDLESVTRPDEQLPMTAISASPEQLQGMSAELRAPTDIFSLAVIVFAFACGRHPFVHEANGHCELPRLLQRIFSSDIQGLGNGPLLDVLSRMLHPVAIYRPTARQVLGSIS